MDYSLYELNCNYDTLPVPVLFEYQILRFMFLFTFHKNSLPPALQDYFQTNRSVHQHGTRNRDAVHLFGFSNTHGAKTILYLGAKFWNDLPDTFKIQHSLTSFLKSVEDYLRSKYFNK